MNLRQEDELLQSLVAVLAELVELKILKDALDVAKAKRDAFLPAQRPAKSPFILRDELDYAIRKPKAWAAARVALDRVKAALASTQGNNT